MDFAAFLENQINEEQVVQLMQKWFNCIAAVKSSDLQREDKLCFWSYDFDAYIYINFKKSTTVLSVVWEMVDMYAEQKANIKLIDFKDTVRNLFL